MAARKVPTSDEFRIMQSFLVVCERVKTTQHVGALAVWEEDESTYILRNKKDGEVASASFAESSDEVKLVHEGGTQSKVWTIGRRAFCKVKAWNPRQESEANTIAFVKKVAPHVSTPEVIHYWTEIDKSFLILKRIEGSVLRDVWGSLSLSQQDSLVTFTAAYCDHLAQNKSQILGSATGKPLCEPYLSRSDSELVDLMTHKECETYFTDASGERPPLEKDFVFYHADLGPGNIIVSDDGKVMGIIDWECAGFYPAFWISTKPSVSRGFDFHPPIDGYDDFEWRKRLRVEFERWGYPRAAEWFMKWGFDE